MNGNANTCWMWKIPKLVGNRRMNPWQRAIRQKKREMDAEGLGDDEQNVEQKGTNHCYEEQEQRNGNFR